MNRRTFIGTAACLPAMLQGEPARSAKGDAIQAKALPFALKDVQLLPGEWTPLMELNQKYLHALESDRLLHTFRLTAGLPSSAEPLGGWEAPTVELRGHFLGHYLSGCAQMAVSVRDEAIKAKADAIVAELAKCQKANGGGYLSAFPADFFERLKTTGKVWAPWYTVHKILAGLFDMYALTGNAQALDALEGMAGWTAKWAEPIDDAQMQTILKVEFGGMNEVLNNLYAATGKRQWADLAARFEKRSFLDPLAGRRDELKGLHANTHIPQAIGAARAYELTGDPRYRTIAEYFWRQVMEHHSYCTGGNSDHEHFGAPDQLAKAISATSEECCCTYNMLKLTRHVFSWTGDVSAADYYERALFNGIFGTMNPKDGMTMYYVPMASGYWKMFGLPRNSFWCCTGTGVESFSKLQDSIYFHGADALYVNLFIPSVLEWREKGLTVRQETGFPDEQGTRLTFRAQKPVELEARIRIPYWAQGATVKVNGRAVEGAQPGTYLAVKRAWKNGDKVEMSLPMKLHAHPMPDDQELQAFMYGPLVLAGRLGSEGLTGEAQRSDMSQQVKSHFVRGEPKASPDLRAGSGGLESWIKPAGKGLAFQMTGQSQDLALVPLNRLFGERYAVYWRMRGAL